MEQGLLVDRVLRRPLTCRRIRVFMFFTDTSAPAGKLHVLRKESTTPGTAPKAFILQQTAARRAPG